jgi:hypothetical protein
MAITSLGRFGVPATDAASSTALLMPKLKYRFRVTFLGFGAGDTIELTKQVVDTGRPKVSFEEMPIEIYNSKIKLAGKYNWDNITINLRDDATGNVQKAVGLQVQKQFDFMEQSSARSGIDYKFQTNIEVLDGGNGQDAVSVLERFELYGCFLQNVDYGDLNYGTNEPATIALTLVYDNAIQFGAGITTGVDRGIGAAVARTIGQTTTGFTGA